ncbi:hypothetical protein HIMB100_00022940 [SAR116 cluster alpha proteobacterium HIMB100]|nr:hypothetical protein HIMB100_00022940 [SAR116 cluster alpha proteobacterium HIMB100]
MVSSNKVETLKGYVTVRPFGGVALPVPVQNLVLRNYCLQKGYTYSLPMGEHKYENCFMQLFATINAAQPGSHIGFCSAHMLPENEESLMDQLTLKVINKSLTLHCVFEGKELKNQADFSNLNRNLLLLKYAKRTDDEIKELKTFIRSKLS